MISEPMLLRSGIYTLMITKLSSQTYQFEDTAAEPYEVDKNDVIDMVNWLSKKLAEDKHISVAGTVINNG